MDKTVLSRAIDIGNGFDMAMYWPISDNIGEYIGKNGIKRAKTQIYNGQYVIYQPICRALMEGCLDVMLRDGFHCDAR